MAQNPRRRSAIKASAIACLLTRRRNSSCLIRPFRLAPFRAESCASGQPFPWTPTAGLPAHLPPPSLALARRLFPRSLSSSSYEHCPLLPPTPQGSSAREWPMGRPLTRVLLAACRSVLFQTACQPTVDHLLRNAPPKVGKNGRSFWIRSGEAQPSTAGLPLSF
jgi:hypothetical protein